MSFRTALWPSTSPGLLPRKDAAQHHSLVLPCPSHGPLRAINQREQQGYPLTGYTLPAFCCQRPERKYRVINVPGLPETHQQTGKESWFYWRRSEGLQNLLKVIQLIRDKTRMGTKGWLFLKTQVLSIKWPCQAAELGIRKYKPFKGLGQNQFIYKFLLREKKKKREKGGVGSIMPRPVYSDAQGNRAQQFIEKERNLYSLELESCWH